VAVEEPYSSPSASAESPREMPVFGEAIPVSPGDSRYSRTCGHDVSRRARSWSIAGRAWRTLVVRCYVLSYLIEFAGAASTVSRRRSSKYVSWTSSQPAPQTIRPILAKVEAMVHIPQGCSVVYSTASVNSLHLSVAPICLHARISAWAVASWRTSTSFRPRPSPDPANRCLLADAHAARRHSPAAGVGQR
jgi:hypothetical protein